MLSKVQLFDASKCDNATTAECCKKCSMYKEEDCFTSITEAAISYYKILQEIKEQYETDFTERELNQLEPRDEVIYNLVKDFK